MTTLVPRDLPRQTFEIAVCRDQDEPVSGSVVQNPAIAGTSKLVSKRTFGLRELSLAGNTTSLGERLSSNRSFILWRLCHPPPIRRRKRTRQGNHPVRAGDNRPG